MKGKIEICSAGEFGFDPANFEIVWQYGVSEQGNPNTAPPALNDGIAPQCPILGLEFNPISNLYGRIPFLGLEEHKSFLDAHYSANYGWILTNILQGQNGYVDKRN